MTEPLYRMAPEGIETRWASPENPTGERSAGGRANGGRKGSAWLVVPAGSVVTLAEAPRGASGTVRRIWMTVDDRSPRMLRGLRLDFFWDGAETPAVSAPLGDFFGVGLGRTAAFESALFSNPEGRSFHCAVPMPFRDGMRMLLTNESGADLAFLFYDVNFTLGDPHGSDALYLHAHFRRENPTALQNDYAFLPRVEGRGRFLGVNVGVRTDRARYGDNWWGEGEAKFYIDGDTDLPTLCGTGTEDYIGTAWSQGLYAHAHQGCTVADGAAGHFCFYRWHVPDPVWFRRDIRVTMQQIGGCFGGEKRWLLEKGEPVYVAGTGRVPADLSESGPPHVLFEREDDWSSCAYFYLDRPESGLPPLPPVAERTADL